MENKEIIEEPIKKKLGRPIKENKDVKEYSIKFKRNHLDTINKSIECNICLGHYTYFNKSTHNKSKLHMTTQILFDVIKYMRENPT